MQHLGIVVVPDRHHTEVFHPLKSKDIYIAHVFGVICVAPVCGLHLVWPGKCVASVSTRKIIGSLLVVLTKLWVGMTSNKVERLKLWYARLVTGRWLFVIAFEDMWVPAQCWPSL